MSVALYVILAIIVLVVVFLLMIYFEARTAFAMLVDYGILVVEVITFVFLNTANMIVF